MTGKIKNHNREITGRKKTEQELQESEKNFRTLAESAFDGIVIVNAAGAHVYSNPRASEMIGYSHEEILGTNLRDWVVPAEYRRLRKRLQDRLAGKPALSQYKTVIRKKNGATLPVEISATRTLWRNKLCALIFFRDVSQRQQMEEDILKIGTWEKQRIGRDLHDSVAQQLAAALYLCHVLKSKLLPSHAEAVREIHKILQQSLEQVRQIAGSLLPAGLEKKGLVPALRRLADMTSAMFTVNCRLKRSGDCGRGDLQTSEHMYYLIREAVMNSARHGRPRNIIVSIDRCQEDFYKIMVQDDGSGFDLSKAGKDSMGLKIMRYRADLMGGVLTIDSRKGGGTRVRCDFPGNPGNGHGLVKNR